MILSAITLALAREGALKPNVASCAVRVSLVIARATSRLEELVWLKPSETQSMALFKGDEEATVVDTPLASRNVKKRTELTERPVRAETAQRALAAAMISLPKLSYPEWAAVMMRSVGVWNEDGACGVVL
jgi:hypothetical protein